MDHVPNDSKKAEKGESYEKSSSKLNRSQQAKRGETITSNKNI